MIYTITLNPAVDRELTVPSIEYDQVLRATEARVDCGGKGFNVSRMVASLGGQSVALGFAGGKSGEFLTDKLTELGIETQFVWVDEETRTNVSIVTADHEHYLKVNEAGPRISQEAQNDLLALVASLATEGDWWVIAGSLPPNVPSNYYAELIQLVQSKGGSVILDSSGDALRHGVGAKPAVVKPNDVEAQLLTKMPIETIGERSAAAKAIQALGVSTVIMSLGRDGAMLASAQELWQITPPKIEERNPIGAGDSLVGGLVWGLAQELSVIDAVKWGIACGAATASMDGTAVGSQSLVESLLSQVIMTPLA